MCEPTLAAQKRASRMGHPSVFRLQERTAAKAKWRFALLHASVVVDGEDHAEGDEGDENFAEDAGYDGTPALVEEVAEVGSEAYAGEGW